VEVKTSVNNPPVGLGLHAAKQLKAGHRIFVKGHWVDSYDAAVQFASNGASHLLERLARKLEGRQTVSDSQTARVAVGVWKRCAAWINLSATAQHSQLSQQASMNSSRAVTDGPIQ
jgi:hypothetical protein